MAQKGLTNVIEPFRNQTPVLPDKQAPDLAKFLLENDCMVDKNFRHCYFLTRLRLIQTTEKLDNSLDLNYAGQVTINGLIENVGTVINGLGDTKDPTVIK